MRIIVEQDLYKGIPYIEYYQENLNHKGLVFVQHGYESNKKRGADYLALNLARLGFFVVSIDARKHGERIEEPFISQPEYLRYADAFYIIEQTADDIILLFENKYKNEFKKFHFIGVSMGGFIAYRVAIKCDYIETLIPVITTPYFYELAETRKNVPELQNYRKEVKKHLEFIRSIDPSEQVDKMTYKDMFLLSCTEDYLISYQDAEKFKEDFDDGRIKLNLYQAGHTVNRVMQTDILEYLTKEKVVL